MKHIKIWAANLMPTLQKHITTKHSNIINMVVMYMFFFVSNERGMQQRCYFWRGLKTYFSTLLMMLISSQSKTCKWNVRTQLSKLLVGGGKGPLGTKCLQKGDSAQLVTSPDFVNQAQMHLEKTFTAPTLAPNDWF